MTNGKKKKNQTKPAGADKNEGTEMARKNPSVRDQFARNLRAARSQFDPNMTQAKVAELFNPPLSRSAVAQWELGETQPDIDRLAVLSQAYGVTIDSLVFGNETKDKNNLPPEAFEVARMWTRVDGRTRNSIATLLRVALERRKAT